MKLHGLLLVVVLASIIGAQNAQASTSMKHDKVVACYVASWASYRKDPGEFVPGHIPTDLCTHLVYAFAGLNTSSWTIRPLDPWIDIQKDGGGNYKKITDLRNKNPQLKVSLAIGGWNEGSKNYSELAASPSRRKIFIESVVNYIQKYNFDGFDLDWEFPAARGGASNDKENFVSLVQELRDAFKSTTYLLTAAISASRSIMEAGYDLAMLTRYLDYIHVMSYDYHGRWEGKILPNAPLRANDGVSVVDTINYLLQNGAIASKLVVGVPMYGRTFILTSTPAPGESPVGKPCEKNGFKGPLTNEEGFMGYNEICHEVVRDPKGWRRGWHKESSTPYVIKNDQVVMYEDLRSIKHKMRYVKQANLAGTMVWSIDTDDRVGRCAGLNSNQLDPRLGTEFPLMKMINWALANDWKEEEDGERVETTTKSPGSGSRLVGNLALVGLMVVLSW